MNRVVDECNHVHFRILVGRGTVYVEQGTVLALMDVHCDHVGEFLTMRESRTYFKNNHESFADS